MKSNNVIIRPRITEKALNKAKGQVYSFEVNALANKSQVKKMIETLFSVTVSTVKTQTNKGKERRVGKRMTPKKLANTKIAFVTVTKGKIDIFPQA